MDNKDVQERVDEAIKVGGGDQPTCFVEVRALKRDLMAEQTTRWEQGQPIPPEEVLAQWPVDPKKDDDVGGVLYEDFCQRRARGEKLSLSEYGRKYPQHQRALESVATRACLVQALGGAPKLSRPALALPEVGDEVFGFRLTRELGRGSFACVFLAGQINLADRPVVIKVSAIDGDEPQTLAQLQHTHIVPIHSVHENLRSGLRAVCMPYFGGASLSSVLEVAWRGKTPPTQGSALTAALAKVRTPFDEHRTRTGELSAFERLADTSYVNASAWVVARLAEGLQHAHERGVIHCDIKPSNVLLGDDGQPMLLDFNLSRDLKADAAGAMLGGTIAYMAPEHLQALGRRTDERERTFDHRADIYALGMVLFEMLVGRRPFDESAGQSSMAMRVEAMAQERGRGAPSARALRPDVPWGIESILHRCLEPDRERRYQRASHLAEDLRRFLSNQPLRHAPELSRVERLRKWARRHPKLTSASSVGAIAAVLLLGVGGAAGAANWHLKRTRLELRDATDRERRELFAANKVRAECLVNTTSERHDTLRKGLVECEQALALYGVLGSATWQTAPAVQRLEPAQRQSLAEDVRELLLLTAWARVQLDKWNEAVLSDALRLLERAQAIEGLEPSPALLADRAVYLGRLARHKEADEARVQAAKLPATTPRDHYLLATTILREGAPDRYRRALPSLNEAVKLNGTHYWSLIQRGICHQELGNYAAAAGDFGVCIGLWPEFAWGHFNRGVALDQTGQKKAAIADYSAAIARDPEFLPARLNRGLALLEVKRYEEALVDFQALLHSEQHDAVVEIGRGVALEGLKRHDDADDAFAAGLAGLDVMTLEAANRLRWVYAFAISARDSKRAAAAFDEVLRDEPANPQALYGRAMLAMNIGAADAMARFNTACDAAPHSIEPRRFRAILRARRGQFDDALRDVNKCLEIDPESGPAYYAAACVASLAAKHLNDPNSAKINATRSLQMLRLALERGYGLEQAEADPDLTAARHLPAFRKLLAEFQALAKP